MQLAIGVLREQALHAHSVLVISLAHDSIDASTVEAEEGVVRPRLLDEVEAVVERALIAGEEQASLGVGVFANFWTIWDTSAEDAVGVDAGAAGGWLVASWIGFADVGAYMFKSA